MVLLRKMKTEEFPAYQEYFLKDWCQELVDNYGYSVPYAAKYAREEFLRDFPNGPDHSVNELLCIESNDKGKVGLVGYLWHAIQDNEPATFIHDFYIQEKHRSKGYGRQAMEVLEQLMLPLEITEIKLRVAYKNPRALSLYKELGFNITGVNMAKNLNDKSHS